MENVPYKERAIDQGDVKYIKVLDDFMNCMYSYKKSGFSAYQMSMMQWWKSLRAKKKVYAEFCWDDPMVWLYSLIKIAKGIAAAFFRRWHKESK